MVRLVGRLVVLLEWLWPLTCGVRPLELGSASVVTAKVGDLGDVVHAGQDLLDAFIELHQLVEAFGYRVELRSVLPAAFCKLRNELIDIVTFCLGGLSQLGHPGLEIRKLPPEVITDLRLTIILGVAGRFLHALASLLIKGGYQGILPGDDTYNGLDTMQRVESAVSRFGTVHVSGNRTFPIWQRFAYRHQSDTPINN